MKREHFHLTILFSMIVFIILLFSMSTVLFVTMWIISNGKPQQPNLTVVILAFAISSIIIGTIFSQFVGRKALAPIIKISEATKEVAKGNFEVSVEENIKASELHEMAKNFNIMIHELSSIELFRNDFIANVSHEFKTPLSAIEGYATLLQNINISDERRQFYCEKIISNTKRLTTLTGNILQLSRLENQKNNISKQVFSLDEQIRQIILLFENQWNKKNINIEIDLETLNYNGNEELLAQVWLNLIGNALKFVEDNGCIYIYLKKENEHVRIDICDDGIGMDEVTRLRIFEKFYQGDTSHTMQGNGLGLTLVKNIVELHKGEITVSSKEGKGTTFTVTLPINKLSRGE